MTDKDTPTNPQIDPPKPEKLAEGRTHRRLLEARDRIITEQPDRTDFLHTVMCQVGMPRRMTRTVEQLPLGKSLECSEVRPIQPAAQGRVIHGHKPAVRERPVERTGDTDS